MNKNYVEKTEVKDFVYKEVRQYFVEKSNLKDEVKEDYFRIKERLEKVIHSGNRTIVILDDGTKGISKCSPEDEYNKLKGIKIAYTRAKIKSLQKELKRLCK